MIIAVTKHDYKKKLIFKMSNLACGHILDNTDIILIM